VGRALGDFGEPEDIAEAAAFLASNRWRGRDRQLGLGCSSSRISCIPNSEAIFKQLNLWMHIPSSHSPLDTE
jgi:hypothetical protein